jgi:hypothetical protein
LLRQNESLKNGLYDSVPSPTREKEDEEIESRQMAKSMAVQSLPKKVDEKHENRETQKVNNINNIIYDVNNNINDLINKINSNVNDSTNPNSNLAKNQSNEVSVKFNLGDSSDKKDKKKIDEEKKNLRISKAMQRIKKGKDSRENNSAYKSTKSAKVANLVKELENNMQRRADTIVEEGNTPNNTNNTVIFYEQGEELAKDNDNVVNVLKNQQLTKSVKKKKTVKKFSDDNE